MDDQEKKTPPEGESRSDFQFDRQGASGAGEAAQPAPQTQQLGEAGEPGQPGDSNGKPDEASAAAAAYEAAKREQMILQLPTCPVCREAPARVNDIMTTHPNGHRFLTVFCGNPGCRAILSVQFIGAVQPQRQPRQVTPATQMPPKGSGPRFRGQG